jgi:hypothetical protein
MMDLKKMGASMFKRAPEPAPAAPSLNRSERRRQEKLARRSLYNGRGNLRGRKRS